MVDLKSDLSNNKSVLHHTIFLFIDIGVQEVEATLIIDHIIKKHLEDREHQTNTDPNVQYHVPDQNRELDHIVLDLDLIFVNIPVNRGSEVLIALQVFHPPHQNQKKTAVKLLL